MKTPTSPELVAILTLTPSKDGSWTKEKVREVADFQELEEVTEVIKSLIQAEEFLGWCKSVVNRLNMLDEQKKEQSGN